MEVPRGLGEPAQGVPSGDESVNRNACSLCEEIKNSASRERQPGTTSLASKSRVSWFGIVKVKVLVASVVSNSL